MTAKGPFSDPGARGRLGPFLAGGVTVVVESMEADVLGILGDVLGDLRQPDSTATDPPDESPTVLVIERVGPAWLTNPWALYRDGQLYEMAGSVDVIVHSAVKAITLLVRRAARPPVIPLHAAALERGSRAVVLGGPPRSGKTTLTAWLTHRGWGYLTDDTVLLDTSDPSSPTVHPFVRPFRVRRQSPIESIIGSLEVPSTLVRASLIGSISTTTPLAAFVFPRYRPMTDGELSPLTSAESLHAAARQLFTHGTDGAAEFCALADLAADVPSYSLTFDDLATAETILDDLLDELATIDPRARTGPDPT